MPYMGYRSEQGTLGIIRRIYPNFVNSCDAGGGYIYSNVKLLEVISKKVNYDININNLSHITGNLFWIPAARNHELNGLLNHIEANPEIPLMSEL